MAKRSRLGNRPGQRRPLQRPVPKPTSTVRPAASVTAEEEARAAELEAAIVAEERAADEARKSRDRRVSAPTAEPAGIYSSAPLAERAAVEYAYVRRDLRRLTVVCGGLLVVLALIYVLLNALNVV
jgi:hypothetical protein